jgi:hypothetical protein
MMPIFAQKASGRDREQPQERRDDNAAAGHHQDRTRAVLIGQITPRRHREQARPRRDRAQDLDREVGKVQPRPVHLPGDEELRRERLPGHEDRREREKAAEVRVRERHGQRPERVRGGGFRIGRRERRLGLAPQEPPGGDRGAAGRRRTVSEAPPRVEPTVLHRLIEERPGGQGDQQRDDAREQVAPAEVAAAVAFGHQVAHPARPGRDGDGEQRR